MIKFIFFGRLVKEKGIDLILDTFSQLHNEGLTNRHLDIYGIGMYDKVCDAFAKLLPDNVCFHGRGDHTEVVSHLSQKDFCLMPSLIIETFGLSALESIRQGTPVIGFKKGGLEPFITSELNIEGHTGNNNYEKLYSLIKEILTAQKNKLSFPLTPDSFHLEEYTPNAWISHFQKIAGPAKRILLVSDFTRRVGGVENYIHDVKDLLQKNGYQVELRGLNKKNSFWGLFKTALNISAWRKIHTKISAFQPDIVWCHSVMRELGRLPLCAIPHDTKTLMMFHDMGYFYPRPSRMYKIHHVPTHMGLISWIKAGHRKNPIQRILLTLKRISLRAIRSVLHHHNTTYLVPSPFMKPFVENLRQGKKQQTITLAHFVK